MISRENTRPASTPSSECAHAGCHCPVSAGQKYCSDYCENMVGADTCNCGHAECNPAAKDDR
ncbi:MULTISPECIES: hypothetical protein [Methylomicrobium]|uniref:Metallothionein n=1 Tax=Methylomicrobium album BG8 TaxID=686340 RepID=H8GIN9_METAL|nr:MULTISPECIES: hypothetical protein [Methylomicrobium]EIC29066.1 hypothetical protein Metal_1266 [Methylomicrobium album BG8]